MLRLDVMANEAFRNDLLKIVRDNLRTIGRDVIAEIVNSDGWLQKRLDEYLQRNPIHAIVERVLAKTAWHEKPDVMVVIEKKIAEATATMKRAIVAEVDADIRKLVAGLVADELKRRLSA